MKSQTYKIKTTNDYRSGREIYFLEVHESDDENNDFDETEECVYTVTFEIDPDRYSVYYLYLEYDSNVVPDRLNNFPSLEQAELYCKQQFYHYTDSFPFVSNGKYSSSYHPDGSRPEVDLTHTEPHEYILQRKEELLDGESWLVIVGDDFIKGHSLGDCDIWEN